MTMDGSTSLPAPEELMRTVLPAVPAVLYLSTTPPERRLLEVTRGWEGLVGGSPVARSEEPRDGSSGDSGGSSDEGKESRRSLSRLVHPDDRERVEAEIREALSRSDSYSVCYRHSSVPARPDVAAGERPAAGGHPTAGGRPRWIWDRGHVVEEGGEPRVRGILLDITELKSSEDRAVQGQRKEALGALAGSVAQEFNDLLTAIYGSLDLARERSEDPRTVKDEIQVAVQAVKRARFLTEQLVSFTRARPQRPRVEDPNELVEKLKPFIESVAGSSVRTVTALDPHGSEALFDPALLEQAIMNLVLNAREAMGGRGGRLLVSTGDVVFDADDLRSGDEVHPGRYATISVSDTGPGIDEGIRRRIYEPFFTTKEGHTGLGLSAAFGIVRQMGGIVRIRSTPGEGTRATIFLPVAGEVRLGAVHGPAGSAEAGASATPGPGAGTSESRPTARVLLVEDDDAVRNLLLRILGRKGYEVVDAGRAEEALALATDSDRAFDLLFTDVMLPGMRGPELVRRVRSHQPSARVLVTSGFPDDPELREGGLLKEAVFLSKPFSVHEVLEAVEEALRLPPPSPPGTEDAETA